ncbi:MAG: hypothetical protein NTZ81_04435, partial [Actinobacteria bacterium]|nr:hypothetical protein [Actinomycetota bacterium]
MSTRAARHQGPLATSTVEHGYAALEQQRRRHRPEPTINSTNNRPALSTRAARHQGPLATSTVEHG